MHKYFIAFLVFATPIWAQNIDTRSYISVTGTASIALVPDQANISLGVEIANEDAKQALNEVATRITEMMDVLKSAGVEDRDMQTANLNVSSRPIYNERNERVSTEYNVSNNLDVLVRKLDDLPNLIAALTDAGMNQINGISFSSSQKDALTNQVLENAVKDARERADLAAAAAGMKIVQANNMSLDYEAPQPLFREAAVASFAADTAGAAPMPISGGTLNVEARANIQYIMEPAE